MICEKNSNGPDNPTGGFTDTLAVGKSPGSKGFGRGVAEL